MHYVLTQILPCWTVLAWEGSFTFPDMSRAVSKLIINSAIVQLKLRKPTARSQLLCLLCPKFSFIFSRLAIS
ncbi:hypothetical protein T4B_13973 [Trichinella pseudospiralis]|uniref:Uncharacterized protein n=1 Tax=Trichinella pseudospiralis TaxID=6337 RepID=A0A0V1E7B5_TRIPS|nr:hypothetical protein T4A_3890 [Trichinella pseudospiralis]KRZ29203.1 hypothetical protein T4B_13973 [Trichinella pseudospiralis]KRZ45353.1 hypothetical protein T4C_4758 [Trichinella pseudospiralis]